MFSLSNGALDNNPSRNLSLFMKQPILHQNDLYYRLEKAQLKLGQCLQPTLALCFGKKPLTI